MNIQMAELSILVEETPNVGDKMPFAKFEFFLENDADDLRSERG